jgi:hypothetical protein
LREQIVYDDESTFLRQFSWEYTILCYLGVCLAIGYDQQPYTFSQLYATLYTLYAFWREQRHPHDTNNEAFAREEAWYLTVRIMKGTNGEGGGYRKDTVYLQGNINCWQLAQSHPEIILFGDSGKFDIANPAHVAIVKGIQSP